MMELNMMGHGEKVPMNLVERFWDSEAPRIGDAHPSEAGLSQWLEASSPGASSYGVSQASQEVVVRFNSSASCQVESGLY